MQERKPLKQSIGKQVLESTMTLVLFQITSTYIHPRTKKVKSRITQNRAFHFYMIYEAQILLKSTGFFWPFFLFLSLMGLYIINISQSYYYFCLFWSLLFLTLSTFTFLFKSASLDLLPVICPLSHVLQTPYPSHSFTWHSPPEVREHFPLWTFTTFLNTALIISDSLGSKSLSIARNRE